MSDGPHKSLAMKRRWKRVAERAYSAAHSVGEITEALTPALLADWREEVRGSFLLQVQRIVCGEGEPLMFADQIDRDLESARAKCVSPLETSVLDEAREALAMHLPREAVLQAAVDAALTEHGLRIARQMEEHHKREVPNSKHLGLRTRLEESIAPAAIARLGRDILAGEARRAAAPAKHDGIDEGVQF